MPSSAASADRWLITGHTGFVGTALQRHLSGQPGVETVGLSRRQGGDLTQSAVWESAPDVSAVIHLAGEVGVQRGWEHPELVYERNFSLTLRMLEFARVRSLPVLFLSSYVYGPPKYLPVDEIHPLQCETPYARSKKLGEELCVGYAQDFGMSITILRPFNPYGPGQSPDALIPWIAHQVKYEDTVRVRDLVPRRDFLYIDDLAAAIGIAVRCIDRGVEIFNVGTGLSHSVGEVVESALRAVGRALPVIDLRQSRRNEIQDCYSDSSRFFERSGWRPQVELQEGVERTLESI